MEILGFLGSDTVYSWDMFDHLAWILIDSDGILVDTYIYIYTYLYY